MRMLYDTDFHQWTQEMAEAIRDGRRVSEADAALIAEEIEDLGRGERKSLRSAVIVLFMHLLKKQYQPDKATRSWDLTIKDQRNEIDDILEENPSLEPLLRDAEFISKAYERALTKAALQTKKDESAFPEECPFDETVFGWPKTQTERR
jgi:hypothetical protein